MDIHFINSLLNLNSSSYRIYSKEISSYSQTIGANIGYDSANLSFRINKYDVIELANWLLGKEMFTYIDTSIVWSGIVNTVSFSLGSENIEIGPYLDIANKILVKYTDYSTGVPNVTTYANNTNSQNQYGVLVRILNGGSISATNADKIRDKYLLENSYPRINKSISTGGTLSFSVNCIGHYHLLGTYNYNNASTSSGNLSTKMQSVVAAQPSSIFSTDYTNIETNTLSVNFNESSDRMAIEIIKELVSLGDDTTDNKSVFGIYNRIAHYRTIDYNTKYYLDVSSKQQNISSPNGYALKPWEIRPGYFMEFIGDRQFSINNQTTSFIDSIVYTYPYSFQIQSGDSGTLSQQLSKLGISGL